MGNEQSQNANPENQAENYYLSGVDRFRPQVYKYNMNGSLVERSQLDGDAIQREAVGLSEINGDPSSLSRFKQNEEGADQEGDVQKQEQKRRQLQREAAQYVPSDPKKDKDVIEFPRNVLLDRQKPHHMSKQDVHSVYQTLSVNPTLLERIDRQINKSENTLEEMESDERKQTIVEQLGRITFLEDRLECLQKEIGNQVFHLKYKHTKALNFQNDYNKLRDETMAHHARIANIEEQTRIKDMTKMQTDMENCELDIKAKEKELEDLNDQVSYWKQKAMIDENCIAIITSLKFRSQHLMRENKRLSDILYPDGEYSDIKSVMYGAKQIQMQQQIFEETDNLLKEYYESSKYDGNFEEKKNGNKSYSTYATGDKTGTVTNTRTVRQTTTTNSSQNVLQEVSRTLKK